MAGLRLLRPGSGLVQLSSADICYQLSSWGSVLLLDSGTNQPQPIVVGEVTVSGTNPILAFRAANGAPVTVRSISASGGSITYRFQAQSAQPVGIIYWCFDVANNAGAQFTGPRMRAWTEQGVKTFDSAAYAMRLSSAASGPNVAVVQSMYANRWVFENMGNTNDGQWVIRTTRSQSAARFNANGTIDTGLLPYEVQTVRTNPANGMPSDEEWGLSAHTFVDVTDLPTATMPSQDALAVSVNATVREVTVSSATQTSTVSPVATVSVTGGAAPYEYEWYRRQGGGGVGAYGPSDEASFQTGTANQPPGSTYEETWGCRVTDAVGRAGYSPDIVFRHIVIAIDLTPDAISYANVATVTNDAIGFAGVPSKQITGVSQAITLRLERFNYAGTADVGYLLGYKGPSATGPWTQVVSLNPLGTATQFADFTIANGEWFYFYGQAETTSGRKTATFDVAVWNESAGHVVLASTNLSMVVDDNNDFNVADNTPDPVNWANLSISTNSNVGSSTATFGQILGINRPITIRVAISNRSGSITTASLGVHINPEGSSSASGPWDHYSLSATANTTQTFTLTNGRFIYFDAAASTSSGRKDHSYTVTITNVTTGAVLDTFTVTTTVDADNNYNVVDYDLNPIDWGNVFFDTTAASYFTTNAYRTMAGINANVSLSVVVTDFYVTGGAIQNSQWAMQSATRGDLILANLGNTTRSATIQPNEQIRFGINIATTGGRREFGMNMNIYNATTGAFIDHFSMSGYVGS